MHFTHALILFGALAPFAHAAYTKAIQSGDESVEQNALGTFCYYPASGPNANIDTACIGADAEYIPFMNAHLNQTLSIAYYGASTMFLGGVDWAVDRTRGKTYICLSGRAADGRYKTLCNEALRDNQSLSVYRSCALAIAQEVVTDGCYVPGGGPVTGPATGQGGGSSSSNGNGSGGSGSNDDGDSDGSGSQGIGIDEAEGFPQATGAARNTGMLLSAILLSKT